MNTYNSFIQAFGGGLEAGDIGGVIPGGDTQSGIILPSADIVALIAGLFIDGLGGLLLLDSASVNGLTGYDNIQVYAMAFAVQVYLQDTTQPDFDMSFIGAKVEDALYNSRWFQASETTPSGPISQPRPVAMFRSGRRLERPIRLGSNFPDAVIQTLSLAPVNGGQTPLITYPNQLTYGSSLSVFMAYQAITS